MLLVPWVLQPPYFLKKCVANFIAEHRAEYAKIRERLANKQPKAAKLSLCRIG